MKTVEAVFPDRRHRSKRSKCARLFEQRCDSYRPEFSVFVGDLASDVDDFQLHQVFKKYPSCKGAKVVTDQYGYSR